MKKKKAKKAGAKKDDKSDAVELVAEAPNSNEKLEETEEPETPTLQDTKEAEEPGINSEEKSPDTETFPNLQHQRQPSISLQSKLRSSSFRQSSAPISPGLFSPADGDTAPDIYRKQALKIDELEKENKRLAKEAADGEKRWKKAEEELEDLRDADGDSSKAKEPAPTGVLSAEVEKLVRNFARI